MPPRRNQSCGGVAVTSSGRTSAPGDASARAGVDGCRRAHATAAAASTMSTMATRTGRPCLLRGAAGAAAWRAVSVAGAAGVASAGASAAPPGVGADSVRTSACQR
jgi:hypothetical protein